MDPFTITEIEPGDREALAAIWTAHFGAPVVVTRGRLVDPRTLPGFAARQDGRVIGAATYEVTGDQAEIVTLDSIAEDQGVGTALLDRVVSWARGQGLRRLWLISTNDNLRALGFYQKGGWSMVALYTNAVEESRKLKPEIPATGVDGIPIQHEIELELLL